MSLVSTPPRLFPPHAHLTEEKLEWSWSMLVGVVDGVGGFAHGQSPWRPSLSGCGVWRRVGEPRPTRGPQE